MRAALATIAAVLVLEGAAHAAAPPTATVRPAPEVTAQSEIFADPAAPGTPEAAELVRHGYVREERFVSGRANLYGYGPDGRPAVIRAGVPYTTRVIVIRPADPAGFSGSVQLNPFHPVMGSGQWGVLKDYILPRGDAYVGVMIGGDATTRNASRQGTPISAPLVLPWFDPQRYAAIQWPDDDGVRWDVFGQVAALIKGGGLLGPLRPQRTYASGWSFTGSFLRTFIGAGFHDHYRTASGAPPIDGYLIGISAGPFRSGYLPINSASEPLPESDPRRVTRLIDVPIIELMSENEALTNVGPQPPDADMRAGGHRLYEVPGLTHTSGGDGRGGTLQRQLAARGAQPAMGSTPQSCAWPGSDLHMEHVGRAALANLERWVRDGLPPPRAPRLALDPTGQSLKDASGNTGGGVRSAQLDVPLAAYGPPPDPARCPARRGLGSASIQMQRVPFTPAQLARLYPGGKPEYLRRLEARLAELVGERWLLVEDAAVQLQEARDKAETAFAQPTR